MTKEKPTAIQAFIAAQSAMGKAAKSAENPHFKSKYADLAAVQDVCFPPLHANGFAIMQPLGIDDHGNEYIETKFIHESGEVFSTRVYLRIGKADMQAYGSAMTYARRYGLTTLGGIATEDDDGNAAANAGGKLNRAGQGMQDAWSDAVKDSVDKNATPEVLARAYADAIIRDFATVKTLKGLEGIWSKREKIINSLDERFPAFYEDILDAYNLHRKEITAPDLEAAQ